MKKKITVIGGGPGGYAAALKAAQLGAEVILAERTHIGGTCLNAGCIPTKALLHTGEFYGHALHNSVAGVNITGISLDWPAAQKHKNTVVKKLSGGVDALLKHNNVTIKTGKALPLSGQETELCGEIIRSDAVIAASGSVNARLIFPGHNLSGVIDSTEALSLKTIPESLVIVGGGVIGTEFAALYGSLGTKITIIEAAPEILPSVDTEIAAVMNSALTVDGVSLFTGAKLSEVREISPDKLCVYFEKDGKKQSVTAEKVLIAIGRRPDISCFEKTKISGNTVTVNKYFETIVPGLYAVGDCNGQSMLAHAAIAQGIAAAEHIMGKTPKYNPKIIPACVYASPEIAVCGMTEQEVIKAGLEYKTGRFDLGNNGKAIIEGKGGLVKIIAESKYGEILGVHMIGPRVTEIIGEAALCMSMEGTAADIENTIHAHPTVSEAFCEAAMSLFGKPLHGI